MRTNVAAALYAACSRLDHLVRHLALNTLWLAGCLTILGAPAATCALHRVVAEWSDGDERPVFGRFWSALRERGVTATLLGAPSGILLALAAVNLSVARSMGQQGSVVVVAVLSVAVPVLLLTATVPSVVADTATGAKEVLRLAARRTIAHPAAAAVGVMLAALVMLLTLLQPLFLIVTPACSVRLYRRVLSRVPNPGIERRPA